MEANNRFLLSWRVWRTPSTMLSFDYAQDDTDSSIAGCLFHVTLSLSKGLSKPFRCLSFDYDQDDTASLLGVLFRRVFRRGRPFQANLTKKYPIVAPAGVSFPDLSQ